MKYRALRFEQQTLQEQVARLSDEVRRLQGARLGTCTRCGSEASVVYDGRDGVVCVDPKACLGTLAPQYCEEPPQPTFDDRIGDCVYCGVGVYTGYVAVWYARSGVRPIHPNCKEELYGRAE